MSDTRGRVREFLSDPANSNVGPREAGRRLGMPESTFRTAKASIIKEWASGDIMGIVTEEECGIVVVDPEFRDLIQPLADDELAQLESNIVAQGCRDPLVVWEHGGRLVLLDGHNRHDICTRHGLDYAMVGIELPDRDAAKVWIIQNQLGRRNIANFVRVELNLKLEPLIAAKAKENLKTSTGGAEARPLTTLSKAGTVNTREEIAKASGVSEGTVQKVKAIVENASEEDKQQLRKGETSINAVYEKVKPKKKPKAPSTNGNGKVSRGVRVRPSKGTIVSDHVPRQTDEEWLATLKIREFLTPHGKEIFDRDALAYRRWKEDFTEEWDKKAKKIYTAEENQRQGLWQVKLMGFVRLPHPRDWKRCGSCLGKACDGCHRRGYVIV